MATYTSGSVFEAYELKIEFLQDVVADDTLELDFFAYDLNEPNIVELLEKIGPQLRAVIDDSKDHKLDNSAESQAARRVAQAAGEDQERLCPRRATAMQLAPDPDLASAVARSARHAVLRLPDQLPSAHELGSLELSNTRKNCHDYQELASSGRGRGWFLKVTRIFRVASRMSGAACPIGTSKLIS